MQTSILHRVPADKSAVAANAKFAEMQLKQSTNNNAECMRKQVLFVFGKMLKKIRISTTEIGQILNSLNIKFKTSVLHSIVRKINI